MASSPQDVQAKLDTAKTALSKTTKSYAQMVKQYGANPAKWPAGSQWVVALTSLAAARSEVGTLVAPAPPVASFTEKVV